MTISKCISLLLLCAGLHLQGAPVVINGKAPGWEGREVRLLALSDPITRTEIQLDATQVDQSGSFRLSANVNSTQCLLIAVQRYKSPICLDPGQTVAIAILPDEMYKLLDTWLPGEINYAFTDVDTQSTTALMARFDQKYFAFMDANAQLMGTKVVRPAIKAFEEAQLPRCKGNAFAEAYVKYTIGELNLTAAVSRRALYEALIETAPLQPQNPAWYGFMEAFYPSYLHAFDTRYGGTPMYIRFAAGLTYTTLDSLVQAKDAFMARPDVRQWVYLNSANQLFADRRYTKKTLIKLVEAVAENPASPTVGEVATQLLARMREDESPLTLHQLGVAFEAHESAPADSARILVAITAPWSTAATRELATLEALLNKYPEECRVVEVRVAAEGVATPPAKWPVYYPAQIRTFMEGLDVYHIPSFAWCDARGNIVARSAPAPTEGLELVLYAMKSRKDQENTIKVGR